MDHTSKAPCLFLVATLVVYIDEETINTTVNCSIEIRATVYSFYISTEVSWFHEGNPIDTENDTRYSADSEGNLYFLNMERVTVALLGRYEVEITGGGISQRDSVQLQQIIDFDCECDAL
jgi:hypothetical protein